MKSAVFASQIAAAAVFAPASQKASSTALKAFEDELGAQAPLGFWTLLALSLMVTKKSSTVFVTSRSSTAASACWVLLDTWSTPAESTSQVTLTCLAPSPLISDTALMPLWLSPLLASLNCCPCWCVGTFRHEGLCQWCRTR